MRNSAVSAATTLNNPYRVVSQYDEGPQVTGHSAAPWSWVASTPHAETSSHTEFSGEARAERLTRRSSENWLGASHRLSGTGCMQNTVRSWKSASAKVCLQRSNDGYNMSLFGEKRAARFRPDRAHVARC